KEQQCPAPRGAGRFFILPRRSPRLPATNFVLATPKTAQIRPLAHVTVCLARKNPCGHVDCEATRPVFSGWPGRASFAQLFGDHFRGRDRPRRPSNLSIALPAPPSRTPRASLRVRTPRELKGFLDGGHVNLSLLLASEMESLASQRGCRSGTD